MTSSQEPTGVLRRVLRRLHQSEAGQGLVEYALIIVVVSLGSLVALNFLSDEVSNLFNKAGSSIRTGADGTGGGGNPGLTNQTITFGALTDRALGSGTFTVSATASSGLTVAFTSATAAQCTVAGTTVTLVAVGTCTINANQAGNGTYNPAPQVQQSFQITAAAAVPAGGTVTVTCDQGFCEDDDTLTGTTAGWSGSPTSYNYQWQTAADISDSCATVPAANYNNIGSSTNTASTTNNFNPPDTNNDECYRVVVIATNGAGPSSSVASAGFYVREN